MIEIDGSKKSGSGTIVRDVIGLATLIGQPVRLTNIRAKRGKPGLRPQHLKAIQAAAKFSAGNLAGDQVKSSTIEFTPGEKIKGGDFTWDIGTAGSTTMMAMTLVPIALFAERESVIILKGGLFQDFAPTAFYLEHILFRILNRMGAEVRMTFLRPGYVPEGSGEIMLQIRPLSAPLKPLQLEIRGTIKDIHGIALSSHLESAEVSDRMARSCANILQNAGLNPRIQACYDSAQHPFYDRPAVQPGAALVVWSESSTGCLFGADMAGAPGRPSEKIGKRTARNFLKDINSGATVDRYLADQIIPYAALASGDTVYHFPEMTDHMETRLWLIQEFLNARFEIQDRKITIHGVSFESNP